MIKITYLDRVFPVSPIYRDSRSYLFGFRLNKRYEYINKEYASWPADPGSQFSGSCFNLNNEGNT